MVFCLTIPAAVGLIILAERIIGLIFEKGAFTSSDTVATVQALALYFIGLFAYSWNKVLVPLFYAIVKPHIHAIAGFLAIYTNVIFINLTIDLFQHRAIPLSVSVTMMINCIFLTAILHWEFQGCSRQKMLTAFLKIIAATAIMTVFLLACQNFTNKLMQTGNCYK